MPGQRLPGLGRGLGVDPVQGLDQREDLLAHRARGLAFGQKVHQPHDVLRRFVLQDGRIASCAERLVVDLFGDRPARRKPEFEAETLRDLHEEAVERTYPKPVQMADHFPQHSQAAARGRSSFRSRAGRLGKLFRLEGRLGQPHEHPIEDLARRFARKGRSQDAVRRLPARQANEQYDR